MSGRAEAGEQGEPLRLWERLVGHAGYVAEGLVYVMIGSFALLAALGDRQPNGSKGALTRLSTAPFGKALLVLLAIGLAAFVLWDLLLALTDPGQRGGHRVRRLWVRTSYFLNALLHSVLVGQTLWSLFGLASADDEKQTQFTWTARVMTLPVGRWGVALTGVGILIFGLWQFYRAFSGDKTRRVDLRHTHFRFALTVLGACGLTGRGVLFGLVGLYPVDAAWDRDPRYSGGIAGALQGLQQQPHGSWLLGAVAIGLICYGLFQILKERYRRLGDS